MKKIFVLILFVFTLFAATETNAQVKKTTVVKSATTKKVVAKKPVAKKPVAKKTVIVKKVVPVEDNSIKIKMTTDSGIVIFKLYDSTPLHRDNFVKLVSQGFYDSLLFHRVIQGFMVQGGDPNSKYAPSGVQLGNGGGDMERIPAEFNKTLFHKKGALAAARDGNPAKASSACQFYVVQGKKLSDAELEMFEQRNGIKYTDEQKLVYKTIGGTPSLDQNYTVFGEVIEGLGVIDKLASVQKSPGDRPIGDIRMKMQIYEIIYDLTPKNKK